MKKLQKTAKYEEKTLKRLFILKNPFLPLISKDRIATLYAQHPRNSCRHYIIDTHGYYCLIFTILTYCQFMYLFISF